VARVLKVSPQAHFTTAAAAAAENRAHHAALDANTARVSEADATARRLVADDVARTNAWAGTAASAESHRARAGEAAASAHATHSFHTSAHITATSRHPF